ncbi:hypothetical protein V6N12_047565 [Hibiscus sabdariffa]|uniref:RRM domain-containing protein n=1 Tax=Hibiscus sabdariffa TaxID=183260 RepID=A0ABR2DBA0_9ROSI
MESHRRFPAKFATRRRPGCAVFVTNVSKRIHWSALCEAFQVYGSVIDTFIAYKNLRRRGKPTTFAFVRFGQQHEARAAADLGDGRIMDGFKIRVFLDKEFPGEKVNPKVVTANHPRVGFALRDLRSFKDVVMGVRKPENKWGSHGLDSGFRNTKDCPLSEEDCRVIIVDDKSDGLHGNDSPPYAVEPETHVAQSYSSGVDLHEVPIISVDGLPAQRHLKKFVLSLNKSKAAVANGSEKTVVNPENQTKPSNSGTSDTFELSADLPEVSRNSLDSRLEKSKKSSKPEKSRMSTDRVDRFRRKKCLVW